MNEQKNGQPEADEAQDYTFALDIGTRSVIGIVGRREGDLFQVIATETMEHPKRAMIDGQIEDIQQVTQVAGKVKERLEKQVGFPLRRVCVAAAGRSLKTSKAQFEMDVSGAEAVSAQLVYELEMGAVSAAREDIGADPEQQRFYCVGYTVVRYHLDDYPFTTILNHKGKLARVEVIATFLPNEVVDSLCASMSALGLEIENLTLEPIAAMNAVLPADLRLLNLALVDIGAGTSDIAVSDGGSVAAYTMVTTAGDEITEELIRHYLVDFHTAEQIKHAAARGDAEISYKDILGFAYTVKLGEVLEVIRPAVMELSKLICEKVIEANGERPPVAVFLVGGGSKAPSLCETIAQELGLDQKKVAVGGNNFMKRVVQSDCDLSGPEFATPIGIALTGAEASTRGGFYVIINDKKVKLFRNQSSSVMDVLLMSGYQYGQLMGKSGKSLSYTLNGEKKLVRGGHFQPANIILNDSPASISTMVQCGDSIVVEPAQPGADAQVLVGDLSGGVQRLSVELDGMPLDAGCWVLVNGERAEPERLLRDGDVVEKYEVTTLDELCVLVGLEDEDNVFLVNGEMQEEDYCLQNGDQITRSVSSGGLPRRIEMEEAAVTQQAESIVEEPQMLQSALESEMNQPAYPVREADYQTQRPFYPQAAQKATPTGTTYNHMAAQAEPGREEPKYKGGIRVTLNGRVTTLAPKEGNIPYQFVDMLNLVDIDPTKPQGDIVLRLNGKNASYLEVLQDGDDVEIRWEKR